MGDILEFYKEANDIINLNKLKFYKKINDTEIEIFEEEENIYFFGTIRIPLKLLQIYKLINENLEKNWNPYIKNLKKIRDLEFCDYLKIDLKFGPGEKKYFSKFKRAFFTKENNIIILKIFDKDNSLDNFSPEYEFITISPNFISTGSIMSFLIKIKKKNLNSKKLKKYIPEIISFWGLFKNECEYLYEKYIEPQKNENLEEKEKIIYNDRRISMTKNEIIQLEKWRTELLEKDPIIDELTMNDLARFIQGYKFIEKEYKERFNTYLKWYKKSKIKNIKLTDFPKMDNLKVVTFVKKTREGYALIVLKICRLIKIDIPIENIVLYVGKCIFEAINKTDPKVDKYIMMIDLKDYTKENIDIDTIKALAPVLGNYFPDVLKNMFIINAGFFARMIYKGIALFLHPVTKEKIQVLGSNKKDNFKILSTVMDADEIPKEYGGELNFII